MRSLTLHLFVLSALTGAALAEPKVTLIDGSWNPDEGGPLTTQPNPLNWPFGVDFDSKGRMWIVELEGGRVHRLANGRRKQVGGDGSKSYKGDGGPLGQAGSRHSQAQARLALAVTEAQRPRQSLITSCASP